MGKRVTMSAGHFHFFHRIAPIMAELRGFFREEGLNDVAIVAPGEDYLAMENLKAGKIDFILDVRPLLAFSENNKGTSVYIIGGMIGGNLTYLHGAKGIKRIEDLKGKRVGLVEAGGSRESLWIKDLIRRHGLVPDKDVTFALHIGYTSLQNQAPHLDRGDYHAVLISEQYNEQAVKAGYAVLGERSSEFSDYPDRVVATTGDMLTRNPETVKAFLRGLIRGYRFIKLKKNWPEVAKTVEEYKWERDMGWEDFDHALLKKQYALIKYVTSDGLVSRKGLETVLAQTKALRMMPEEFSLDQVLRQALAEEASKEIKQRFGRGYE
ncbi:ABC transporter substrate-binding protein [Thermodesulfobacteriota bacterium]